MIQIPGMIYIGQVEHAAVNGGQAIPCFAPADQPNSINTTDGWNALADRTNRRSFRQTNGRDPVDDTELYCWVEACL